jgi:hypothetical protein
VSQLHFILAKEEIKERLIFYVCERTERAKDNNNHDMMVCEKREHRRHNILRGTTMETERISRCRQQRPQTDGNTYHTHHIL